MIVESSVLGPPQQNKTGEFHAYVIKPGQTCYDQEYSGRSENIARGKLVIGGKNWIRDVLYSVTDPEGIKVYFISYCYLEQDKAFVFTFNELQLEEENTDLYYKILKSFKFL